MKKFGFTLAEVLITLVIIGIIAAITIPAVMNRTDDAENIAAFKKALSVINQAINTEYSLEGTTTGYTDNPIAGLPAFASNWKGLPAIMAKRTNIINPNVEHTKSENYFAYSEERTRVFATSDGIVYWLNEPTNAYRECTMSFGCAFGMVDVNGEKGPNKRVSIKYDKKKKKNKLIVDDRFVLEIHGTFVRPYGSYENMVLLGKKYYED